jgi:hypothetical protein
MRLMNRQVGRLEKFGDWFKPTGRKAVQGSKETLLVISGSRCDQRFRRATHVDCVSTCAGSKTLAGAVQ